VAFTTAEKLAIKKWLGFSLFQNSDFRIDQAILAVQSTTDGGTQPDDSAVTEVRKQLGYLAQVEARQLDLHLQASVGTVDEIEVDAARGDIMLRQLGRQYIAVISGILGLAPYRDVFSPVTPLVA
jgi:hypothetical protein